MKISIMEAIVLAAFSIGLSFGLIPVIHRFLFSENPQPSTEQKFVYALMGFANSSVTLSFLRKL